MSQTKPNIGPSIWTVSDGRAGNAAQTRALAHALGQTNRWMQIAHIAGEGHRTEPVDVSPRRPWTWLPADAWPLPRLALPRAQRSILQPPWPTLWIAAGRRSAPFTKAVRKWSGGQTLTVQILDPRVPPEHFDLVVVPEHDSLQGANVLTTLGSPSHFSEERIEDAGQRFADLGDMPGKSALVSLGGHSKAHTFTESACTRLIAELEVLARHGWKLRITTSRRTPLDIVARMRGLADRVGAAFWASPDDGPNPYLGWLLYSDAAIVTEDSANLLSDATWHGLPVHIVRLSGSAPKFDHFHTKLIERGCARWFEGQIETWDYAPVREAERVADHIVDLLLRRHPQPQIGRDGDSEDKTVAPDWL